MSDNSNREKEIFEHALDLASVEERRCYLESACGGDTDLLARVQSLLRADEAGEEFMPEHPKGPPRVITEKPGDAIGHYKLLEQIGEGGCGVVYMAEQSEPVRRRVALKIIKLGMDTKSVIARFEAERQALALMDHPNIARVFDAGATDTGRPYFVMELVRGVRITDYCEQQQLGPHERLGLFVEVCRAIQHAHQKGIIHRDIKPSNILVTSQDGTPVSKVIDFGIAKATQGRLTDQTVYTAFEQFLGTPAYMSPEQAEMSALDIDTRSDIYSLGVLLYELLTDTTPFDAKELLAAGVDQMRKTIREKEPPRPSTRLTQRMQANGPQPRPQSQIANPKSPIDSDLDWIVMKCLEKDRARRYETANGLATDIIRHLNNEPIVARPPSSFYRFGKAVQRNKLAFVASMTLAVALLLALLTLSISNVRITRERNQKENALKERGTALSAARQSEQVSREQLFRALRSQAEARRLSRRMGQRFESLEVLAEAARIRTDETLRDAVIASLALPDVRRSQSWPITVTLAVTPLACDPLYQRLALRETNGVIRICKIPGGETIQELGADASRRDSSRLGYLQFSDDGRFLAELSVSNGPTVWRLADGVSVLKNPPQTSIGAFNPDSREFAVGMSDRVQRFDLETGLKIGEWKARDVVRHLTFAPGGHRVAVSYTHAAEVTVHDPHSGSEVAVLPVGLPASECAAWHPDGQHLVVPGPGARIQLWDADAPRLVAVLEGHAQTITWLGFHPSGDWLASSSWDGTTRLWETASGRQVLQIPFGVNAAFSSNGRWLGLAAAGTDRVQLLEMDSGREYRTLMNSRPPFEGFPHDGDISSDGRVLVMGMSGGVGVWELASGRELTFLPQPGEEVISALFEPGDRALLTCGRRCGVQRWAIQTSPEAGSAPRFGPGRRLADRFEPDRIALNQDARSLAAGGKNQVVVLDLESGEARAPTMRHPGVAFVGMSRDGRWLATSGWHCDSVRLWEARTGKMVHEWSVPEGQTTVAFTPDSRNLILCRHAEFAFWDLEKLALVQTLHRDIPEYPGHVAFSHDGKLMALEMAPGLVHLKEITSGRTVATLEDPFGDRATWMAFTPAGTELIVAARYNRLIHVWNLGAIRVRLKAMGMDWDWPEFAPSAVR